MSESVKITSPEDESLQELCARLAELAPTLEAEGAWPGQQLELCGEYGVFEWFVDPQWGGQGWSDAAIIRGYLRLSAACLTTTFVITQRAAACRRIAVSENDHARSRWLPNLTAAKCFATVGISHLTTSRRHLAQPVLCAESRDDGGFVLDGFSPWVTGAAHADVIVTGATLDDGRQILAALPAGARGVSVPPPVRLMGLSASQTGRVNFDRAPVPRQWLLAGPVENAMPQGGGAGGLQTSALAIGLAAAALESLVQEASKRPDLRPAAVALGSELRLLQADLLSLAQGQPVCSQEELRTRANSLALRATQAALTAAKGTGYVIGHSAGRWCREALFFLVWSCPQAVLAANLCELAGIDQ